MINFSKFSFHPVVHLPKDYEVYDFTQGYDPHRKLKSPYGIGKYNEKRVGMYTTALFEGIRNVHVGIDIGGPVNTAIHSFYDAKVFLLGNNSQPGDYGYTLITESEFEGVSLYVLYGHLSARSLEGKKIGMPLAKGEVIAWMGDKHENGGWNPHLHFQLSYVRPNVCDMPGVVSVADREASLLIYPDPQLVLGKLV